MGKISKCYSLKIPNLQWEKWGKSQVQAYSLKTLVTSWLCLKCLGWCQVAHYYTKKKPIERLLPSLCETELKSSKTLELSAMRAWWVTRLSAVYLRKFIFMDMHVCSSKKKKVSLQMKIKIRSLLLWDFLPLFPIKKDERKKSGWEKPKLKNIYWFNLSKNIKWSKSVVKNLPIFSKK